MKRNATAVWNGTLKEGEGKISTQSNALREIAYSFNSRFAEGTGTNPEELMAAAHAGCYTMKLNAELVAAGFKPETIETQATITLADGVITTSDLVTTVKVKDIDEAEFNTIANSAKANCPVSKAYNMEINLQAKLNNS